MKKENSLSKMANMLVSAFLYKISGGKILTKLAREYRKLAREKNLRRIELQQTILDEEHLRLRGWDVNSQRMDPVPVNTKREQMLEEEFKRTRESRTVTA